MPFHEDRVAHYVKPNETTRIPRRHIFLHSVAKEKTVKDGSVKRWSTACATFRAAPKGRKHTEYTEVFTDARKLWDAVTAHCKKGARTVLWAHNLGYDVRLADALHALPRLGWELVAHNLSPKGTWLVWSRAGTTLTMVDSASVFPKLLHQVGAAFGLAGPKPAQAHESAEYMAERATAGERIVRTAITAYLEWLDAGDMGNWQFTGAGQSYATFRHKFLSHKMLVHDDVDAIAMERRAMWTGRCEAFWHGTLKRQVVHEYDYTSAYASIVSEHPVPVRIVGPIRSGYPWLRACRDPGLAVLGRVTVTTPLPVVPTLVDGRITWPIGTFETTLWDVEILEAIDNGATVEFHDGYMYKTAPALKAWGEWILASLAADEDEVPAWQKIVIKHHSTACIGRFAMAYPAWEGFATSDRIGVDRRTCIDEIEGTTYEIMQVGKNLFRQGGISEWGQSQPAITGYVMALSRVKLWRLIRALPVECPLYVDTDSILVTDQWAPTMHALSQTDIGRGLRLKKSWDGFSIYGPRQIITGQRVRVAGVPVSARPIAKNVFEGSVWESLPVSMSNGRSDRIVLRNRIWHAKCVDRRRTGPALGWTKPIEVGTA